MKQLILLCCVFINIQLVAQISKDSLLRKMSKEVCAELNSKDLSKIKEEDVKDEMQQLFMPAIMGNIDDIQRLYSVSNGDIKVFEKLGYDLAMKLVANCPAFMEFSMKMAKNPAMLKKQKAADDDDMPVPPPLPNSNNAVSGGSKSDPNEVISYTPPRIVEAFDSETVTLISINPGDITTLTIKNSKGKIEKLYWMEYFENADAVKTNSKKYVGKKVVIATSKKDVYNAATKEYKSIKILESLDLAY